MREALGSIKKNKNQYPMFLNPMNTSGLTTVANPGNEDPKAAPKIPMQMYRFLGKDAEDFHSKGWRPIELSNERIVYKPNHPAFNLQRKAGDKAQSFLSVISKPNGTFDVEVRDAQGRPQGNETERVILRNADYAGLNKWMNSVMGHRADGVQEGTNPDKVVNGSYVQLKDQ